MEEEIKKVEEAINSEDPAKIFAKLEIIMLPNGNIGLKGPIMNKALCKALLAGASQVLDEQKGNILVPQMTLVPGGSNIGRG